MELNILEQVYETKINLEMNYSIKVQKKMIERTYLGCNLIWMMM